MIYTYIIFFNQQFITWHAVADHGSYFVTTYKRCRQHKKEETEERKRKKEEKEN